MILRGVIMKTKYERMSKEEKKKLYIEYKKDNFVIVKKMQKMLILCYVGLLYGVLSFCYDFFYKNSVIGYVLDIVLFIFCLFALLKVISIKKELLNKYALKKDNIRKKEIVKKYKK